MLSKLFIEDGDYICNETNELRNMMVVEIAWTPDGINVGWDEVAGENEAMTLYNIRKKDDRQD